MIVFVFVLQRSFRRELFEDAVLRMERAVIKSGGEVERFRDLAFRASEIAIQNIKREVDFNDAPEEFKGVFLSLSIKCVVKLCFNRLWLNIFSFVI